MATEYYTPAVSSITLTNPTNTNFDADWKFYLSGAKISVKGNFTGFVGGQLQNITPIVEIHFGFEDGYQPDGGVQLTGAWTVTSSSRTEFDLSAPSGYTMSAANISIDAYLWVVVKLNGNVYGYKRWYLASAKQRRATSLAVDATNAITDYYINQTIDTKTGYSFSVNTERYVDGGGKITQKVTNVVATSVPTTIIASTSKKITWTYTDGNGGKVTATTPVKIYGVSQVSTSVAKTAYKYGIDTTIAKPSVFVTYGNGITKTYSNLDWTGYDPDRTGDQDISVTFVDTNTSTSVSQIVTITVYEPTLSVSGYEDYYEITDAFNPAATVIANFGNAGSVVLTNSQYSLSSPDMESSGIKTVDVSYAFDSNYKTSFDITVDSLNRVSLDSSYARKRFFKGEPVSTEGLIVTEQWVFRGSSVTDDYETELPSTSTKGSKTVDVWVTRKGVSRRVYYSISVVEISSFEVIGVNSLLVIDDGYQTKVSKSDFTYKLKWSDGITEEIPSSDITMYVNGVATDEHIVTEGFDLRFSVNKQYKQTESETIRVNAVARAIRDFEVTSVDKKTYTNGDVFEAGNIKATIYYNDGSFETDQALWTDMDGMTFDSTYANGDGSVIASIANISKEVEDAYHFNGITSITLSNPKTEYLPQESASPSCDIIINRYDGDTETGKVATIKAEKTFPFSDNGTSVSVTYEYEDHGKWEASCDAYIAQAVAKYYTDPSSKHSISDIADVGTFNNGSDITPNSVLSITGELSFVNSNGSVVYTKTALATKDPIAKNLALPPTRDLYEDIPCSFQVDQYPVQNFTAKVKVKTPIALNAYYGLARIGGGSLSIVLDEGDSFAKDNLSVRAVFNTDPDTEVELPYGSGGYSVSGADVGTRVGTETLDGTISYTFGNVEVTKTFSIYSKYYNGLSVTLNPTWSAQKRYEKQTISYNGFGTAKAIYSYSSGHLPDEETDVTSLVDISPSEGSELYSSDNFPIDFSWSNGRKTLSVTKTIKVWKDTIESFYADASSMKLSYIEGQEISYDGLKIYKVYSSSSTPVEIPLGECEILVNGNDELGYSFRLTMSQNGKGIAAKITENGTEYTAVIGTLSVERKEVSSIDVHSSSKHATSFKVGDKYSSSGLVIERVFNDGSTDFSEGFTTNADGKTFVQSETGTSTITVTDTESGKTCTYNVTISYPTLVGLTLDASLIQQTVTNGTDWSISNLKVSYDYDNGYSPLCDTWTSNADTVLGLTDGKVTLLPTQLGVKEITVIARDLFSQATATAKLSISVTPNQALTNIFVQTEDGYDSYRVGDTFDAHGIKVLAAFKDIDGYQEVKGFITSPAIGSVLREGGRKDVSITYTSNGVALTEKITISVNFGFESGTTETKTYEPAFNVDRIVIDREVLDKDTLGFDLIPLYEDSQVVIDSDPSSEYYGMNILSLGEDKNSAVGYIDLGNSLADGTTTKNAHIVFFEDVKNPINGSSNISVTFPKHIEGNADLINKCRFGILFGDSNSENRLFASGNPSKGNFDWHSSEPDPEWMANQEDASGCFGYFESDSVCKYGESDNSVTAYAVVSDSRLLVLKGESDKEKTIYFRIPTSVNATDNAGSVLTDMDGSSLSSIEFRVEVGNNTSAAISPNGIITLNGDTLFLSNHNSVEGLDLVGVSTDKQRYASSRSYFIDYDLKGKDLGDSILWSDGEYLYLTLGNKVYMSHYKTKTDNQYEWWVADIKNISSMLKVGSKTYFGTSDGYLCDFGKDFEDKFKIFLERSELALSESEGKTWLAVSRDDIAKLDETKSYKYAVKPNPNDPDSNLYYKVGEIVPSESEWSEGALLCDFDANVLKARDSDPDYLEMATYYLDVLEGDLNPYLESRKHQPYSLISLGMGTYRLVNGNGEEVDLHQVYRARMSQRLTDKATISEIDRENSRFSIMVDGKDLDIVDYAGKPSTKPYRSEIWETKPVEAYYITKPYFSDSLEMFKTVWSFTLANDTGLPSELDVCYASNKLPYDSMRTLRAITISKEDLGIDMSDLSFLKIDMDKDIVPRTYTSKRVISSVKFLCFGFRNLNATNSIISQLSVTYTLPFPSYGGD